MKLLSISRSLLVTSLILGLLLTLSCNSDDPTESAGPSGNPSLTVGNFTDCKTVFRQVAGADMTEECLHWSYDNSGLLQLTHENAGFNCCVDLLLAVMQIDGDQITITESEDLENGGCHCLCLYDLDLQVSSLPAREYTITVFGPCMDNPQTPGSDCITFTVDLTTQPTGSYCVERDHYPWM